MPYNEQEERQIAYIHEQYKACGLGAIPHLLEIEDEPVPLGDLFEAMGRSKKIKGKYPAKKEHFEATEMKQRLHQGPLRESAENILIKICAYQKERSSRFMGAGTLDDPIYLLLEEVKDWTIQTLSALDGQADLQTQIHARILYLKALERSELFPSSRLGDLHLGSTLLEVIDELEAANLMIKARLASASAEVDLKQWVHSAKQLLKHVTQYVYFMFRSDTSDDFTFANMRHPHPKDKAMRSLLKTQAGQCLQTLIQSPPFLKLFPEEQTLALKADLPETELMVFPAAQAFDENPFISPNLLPTPKNQGRYGVYAIFLAQPNIMAAFIALHALLLELGHFTVVCEDLAGLARWGGDMLIYGLANQTVAVFLQRYFHLIEALGYQINVIQPFARAHYKAQKQTASRDSWLKNYNQAESIYAEIEKDKSACDGFAKSLLAQSTQGMDDYQRQKIRDQITQVLGEVNRFSQRMGDFLSQLPLPHASLAYADHTPAIDIQPYAPVFHPKKDRKKDIKEDASHMPPPPLHIQEHPMEQKNKSSEKKTAKSLEPETRRFSHREKDQKTVAKSLLDVPAVSLTDDESSEEFKSVDTSSLTEEESSEEPQYALIAERADIPGYIRKLIESFNNPPYETEIVWSWNHYFEQQKQMGQKGKPQNKADVLTSDFLLEFQNDLHLPTAGPLSTQVTKLVKAFEQNDLDHEPPKGMIAEILKEDTLWESCHHELFYLKYLCVKAAKSDDNQWSRQTDERDLKDFIERLKDESPTGKGLNYFSDYKNLKNQLIQVYANIKNYHLTPRKIPHHQAHQVKENHRLKEKLKIYEQQMDDQEETHQKQILEFEGIIKRKDHLIHDQKKKIKKGTEKIENQNGMIEKQKGIIITQDNLIETQKDTIKEQTEKNAQYDTKFQQQSLVNKLLFTMLVSQGNLSDKQRKDIEDLLKAQEAEASDQKGYHL